MRTDVDRPAARERTRVLVVRLDVMRWTEMLRGLRGWDAIALEDHVLQPKQVPAVVAASRPDVLILDGRLFGGSPVVQVSALLGICPGARIVLISELLSQGEYRMLALYGVAAFLVWAEAEDGAVERAVRAVVGGDLRVFTTAVMDVVLGSGAAGAARGWEHVELSEHEHEVFERLAGDMARGGIIEAATISMSGLERVLADVRGRVGVRGLFALGVQLERRGLLRHPPERGSSSAGAEGYPSET